MKESAIPPHTVDDPKPKLRKAVRGWLSDGSRFFGYVDRHQMVACPFNWELEERKKNEKASQKISGLRRRSLTRCAGFQSPIRSNSSHWR